MLCKKVKPTVAYNESTVRGYYEMDEWIDAFSDDDVVEVSFKHSVESSNKRGKNCRKRRKVVLANKVESGDCDKTLWLSKYKPKTCAEVSGNKAKILQLRTWIEQFLKSNIQKQDSKLLLLTGPSGCGKTAAIEAVAKELSCSVVLWNGEYSDYVPVEHRGDNYIEYQSQGSLFDSFLTRATKYNALPLSVGTVNSAPSHQIVLVEDIPSVYLKAAADWHNKLKLCNKTARHLIVIIFNTSGTVSERTMFPEALKSELNIKHFDFNPIPKTDVKRALNRISEAESHLHIPRDFIENLSESCDGDIRTAINTLQFSFSNTQSNHSERNVRSKSSFSASGKGKRSISTSARSKAEKNLSRYDYQKDPSLLIFRALGKVLYCKRKESKSHIESKLPSHLMHHARCDMAFNPEQVFEYSKVSPDYYTLCLHHNYPQFLSSLEDARRAADYFSHADCLSDQFTSLHVTGKATAGVSVSTRGLMHSNTLLSSKPGWVPLHKPFWFSARKQISEHQATLKWQNDSVYSAAALSNDIIPMLHEMSSRSSLKHLIPPFAKYSHLHSTRGERMDDQFARDDVMMDLTLNEQSVYSTAVPVFTLYFVEDVTSHSGESGEMCNTSTSSVQDDLEEFFIEDSS
ncbi:RAD17 [Bugula neritina]|uniref:RAD17 n=1 Tax=Bugula neritina TaxID=10212 RepID=A0A7J7JCH8_BUGNE|nr:RAD17 [Bugula neritina]